jgi:hypothetical protein
MLLSSVSFSAPPPALPRLAAASPRPHVGDSPAGDTFQPSISWSAPPASPAAARPQSEKPRGASFGELMAAAVNSQAGGGEFEGWNIARL